MSAIFFKRNISSLKMGSFRRQFCTAYRRLIFLSRRFYWGLKEDFSERIVASGEASTSLSALIFGCSCCSICSPSIDSATASASEPQLWAPLPSRLSTDLTPVLVEPL
uniref:Uncharacterized protein n=1 Tax=Romanomermis culicivorax TaxID=13658 RepID=A0A915HRD8_ROMCU